MKSLRAYIKMAAKDGRTRSGMVLGIRLAMLALKALSPEKPGKALRDLVVFVETDRCLPDAIELVTGCRLGNRRLKFKDMGKMAATFLDLTSGRAIRVAARERKQKRSQSPAELDQEAALARFYTLATDKELFRAARVRVSISPEDVPGYYAARTICASCGEGVSFSREVRKGLRSLCLGCAGSGYCKPV